MVEKIVFLLPVYNDWASLGILLKELTNKLATNYDYTFLIANDGSEEKMPGEFMREFNLHAIDISHNIGHQRALSIGLSYLYENVKCSRVLVMDADGNDRPADAIELLKAASKNPDKIIMAQRQKRTENFLIGFFYTLYIAIFKTLTGKSLRYGNFCVIPFTQLGKIINRSDICLNLPSGIIRSKIPYIALPTNKGKRLDGNSKMNFTSLLYHGLGAISVFIDIIALRLLLFSAIAIGVSLLTLLVVLYIHFFTHLGIPGWASTLGTSLIIIILISFLISLFLIFLFIISQSYKKFIPALHYKDYIVKVKDVDAKPLRNE